MKLNTPMDRVLSTIRPSVASFRVDDTRGYFEKEDPWEKELNKINDKTSDPIIKIRM